MVAKRLKAGGRQSKPDATFNKAVEFLRLKVMGVVDYTPPTLWPEVHPLTRATEERQSHSI